jgi:hypothetical protein
MTSAELAELIDRHFGYSTPFSAEDFQARTGRQLGVGETLPATLTLIASQALTHIPRAVRKKDRRRDGWGDGTYVLRHV